MIFTENYNLEDNYITKDYILEYVSEEDIFELVFGFKPVEFQYTTSPFRNDTSPGCWFEYTPDGSKLKFKDFASQIYIRGVRMINIDCFDSVMIYFKIKTFKKTLLFIKEKLIDGKNIDKPRIKPVISIYEKPKFSINFTPRQYTLEDKEYWWNRYMIDLPQLVEDNVFAVESYSLLNTKKGNFKVIPEDITYCYTGFEGNTHRKIYRPLNKEFKWTTDCTSDDIYGYNHLPENGEKLIITKSYKDYRVLKNQGYVVVGFQNEGAFPSMGRLLNLCNRFEKVIVFFDNDSAGIFQSEKLVNLINKFIPGKASGVTLPTRLLTEYNISDPGDLIHIGGRDDLLYFTSRHL